MTIKYSILFLGRENCQYTAKLEKFLKKFSKNFTLIKSKKIGQKIEEKKILNKNFDFIICFRSFFIIKQKLLKKVKICAINFHPGTPKYRGIGCINFALFNNESKFGTTAHIINKKIDYGKILDVKNFKFNKNDNLEKCLEKTHKNMFVQSKKVLNYIFSNSNNLEKLIKLNKNKKWSKRLYKKKDLEKLYKINKRISIKKFDLLKRATIYGDFKPYILHFKKKFVLND